MKQILEIQSFWSGFILDSSKLSHVDLGKW